ncbi:pyruvate kinase [Spirosoma sp.]|uniref:pyruvate kinase n=1 Tax=Spirosoma sp. TaxID=1899569 RepID=UPI003B3B668A
MEQDLRSINELIQALLALRNDMLRLESEVLPDDRDLAATYQKSARNLLHYLAMRQQDLRPLQAKLTRLGVSSLGRAEAHALATVDAVLDILHRLRGDSFSGSASAQEAPNFAEGEHLLAEHTIALFGDKAGERPCRIMVTMPSEAADDYDLIYNLLEHGMDCMRINCAHDSPVVWLKMITHLKQAEKKLERSCKILMDLAGPKIRTGPLPPGEAVLKVKPQRNTLGQVMIPARIWLSTSRKAAPASVDNCLRLNSATWLSEVNVGDKLTFKDARGSNRSMTITDVTKAGCWAELSKTAYFVSGTELRFGKKVATVTGIKPVENFIRLKPDDTLVLTRNTKSGFSAQTDHQGETLKPATIGCTLPKALQYVQVGEQIWFDDGKIGGVVEHKDRRQLRIRIIQAKPNGTKLRSDKGINLPDSKVSLSALTPADIQNLAFVVKQADIVALSFVNQPKDVDQLVEHIRELDGEQPAIVLKIETQAGFRNLPNLLLRLMQSSPCGVMLARGDLAVECGFERLSEVQEEILWLCEAAHVPVIWATQVLETLAKTGIPSRAEITDAAMGHRSECVMLNKGPYILQAVDVLDGILRRMQAHQDKKDDLLRELQLAHGIKRLAQ